jgi:probable HAF family extracellular repeat protein
MKKKKLLIIFFCVVLLIAAILIISRPHNQGLYKVTILPSLGGDFTLPLAINDHGQIAGFSEISQGTYHLFIWDKENGIRDLGPVERGNISINNAGQIAASMTDPNGNKRSFVWNPNSGMTILPTLGGKNCFTQSISNLGQVVGSAQTPTGLEHQFIWDAVNGIRDLTPNSTTLSRAWSINDAGQIVVLFPGATLLVKVNEDKIMQSVPVPLRGACNINNNGYVAGMIKTSQGKYDIATWHQDYGQKSLFHSVTGSSYVYINDLNQVIICEAQEYTGFMGKIIYPQQTKNFLVDPNLGRISLNGYISINRNENLCLTDINNKGWLIGAVQSTKDSRSKGVLFEPVPEKWEKLQKKSTHR